MSSTPVTVDIDDKRIWVRFSYTRTRMALIKSINGVRVVDDPLEPGAKAFTLPKDIETAKQLRKMFGDDLELTPAMKKWAKEFIRHHQKYSRMSEAPTAELERLPLVLPKLHAMVSTRPFQLADIAYMASVPNCINANEPGTGKTAEVIGCAFESGLDVGPNLIAAPVSSLETVWEDHLTRFDQPHPVLVAPQGRPQRIRVMQRAMAYYEADLPFWLIVNPAMLQLQSTFERCEDHEGNFPVHLLRKCKICKEIKFPQFAELEEITWNIKVLDEFHLAGLGNPNSATHKGFKRIPSQKTIATSGSPIGGKPIKLYGILSVLYPKDFTSKDRFTEQWLVIREAYDAKGKAHKTAEGIRPDREPEFWKMMSAYMLRRTTDEVAKDMPPVVEIDTWVEMDPRQAAQYEQFEEEAEIRIDEYQLGAIGILAEYARLKQFANAEQRVEVLENPDPDKPPILKLMPTENSSKLPEIERLLAERGIVAGEDASSGPGVIIGSESERFISMVNTWLNKRGIPTGLITGPVKPADRKRAVEDFQAGKVRVMCMSTQAGGVAISLDQANTVIVLDETWNPDDQEQLIRRARRISNPRPVTAYFIRSRRTIQQYIQDRCDDKSQINARVIDFRKNGLFRAE